MIPPRWLKEQFEAVLTSEINRTKSINDARSYANQTVSRARAKAQAVKSTGSSERKRMGEFVSAEARRFEELLPAYKRNPDLFVRQHRTEVFQRVLTNAQEKIQLPRNFGGEPYELRLKINRTPDKVISIPAPSTSTDSH